MSIIINSLTFNPSQFAVGNTKNALVSFTGFVDVDADNPVSVVLSIIDPASPLNFVDGQNNKSKSISFSKQFKIGNNGNYTKTVTISVDNVSGSDTSEIDITGTTAGGDQSTQPALVDFQ
jgi:hypothetical protein